MPGPPPPAKLVSGAADVAQPASPRSLGKRKGAGAGAPPSPKMQKLKGAVAADAMGRGKGAGHAASAGAHAAALGRGGGKKGVAQHPTVAAACAAVVAEREAVYHAASCAIGMQQSISWVRDAPDEGEAATWTARMGHVRKLCEASKGSPEDSARLVYALRQLRGLRCTLTTLRATNATAVLAPLCLHASAPVADLARDLVSRWRAEALSHVSQLFRAPSSVKTWLAERRAANAAAYHPGGAIAGVPGATTAAAASPASDGRRGAPASPGGRRRQSGGPGGASTPTSPGKGRKLCSNCGQVVGAPTRVCPHCNSSTK